MAFADADRANWYVQYYAAYEGYQSFPHTTASAGSCTGASGYAPIDLRLQLPDGEYILSYYGDACQDSSSCPAFMDSIQGCSATQADEECTTDLDLSASGSGGTLAGTTSAGVECSAGSG